ncbi:MAG: divalent-cation tolerance protein CutA [Verrucomicrobiota bacterium]
MSLSIMPGFMYAAGEMIERQNDSPDRVVIGVTTFSDAEKARQFGTQLVEAQLVACVNLLPGVESIYRWKGDVEVEGECVMLMKMTASCVEGLEKYLQKHHPYEQPEFLVLSVEAGSTGYLGWVRENTRS